ncbi:MAG: imidazoleglycerol-phosphate dehydratase HisB [Desulfosalsimonadaceae bacterium]
MTRVAEVERNTRETRVYARLGLDGTGANDIATGIAFFDHMLVSFAVHGFFDLELKARGDIEVDYHHTVEDTGLVLGEAISRALSDRVGIRRFGHAVTPMDDALARVSIDLSNRPYLAYHLPRDFQPQFADLAREFFRSIARSAGMNLHVNLSYGRNDHHVTEAIFKSFGRALDQAVATDERIRQAHSAKGRI